MSLGEKQLLGVSWARGAAVGIAEGSRSLLHAGLRVKIGAGVAGSILQCARRQHPPFQCWFHTRMGCKERLVGVGGNRGCWGGAGGLGAAGRGWGGMRSSGREVAKLNLQEPWGGWILNTPDKILIPLCLCSAYKGESPAFQAPNICIS